MTPASRDGRQLIHAAGIAGPATALGEQRRLQRPRRCARHRRRHLQPNRPLRSRKWSSHTNAVSFRVVRSASLHSPPPRSCPLGGARHKHGSLLTCPHRHSNGSSDAQKASPSRASPAGRASQSLRCGALPIRMVRGPVTRPVESTPVGGNAAGSRCAAKGSASVRSPSATVSVTRW